MAHLPNPRIVLATFEKLLLLHELTHLEECFDLSLAQGAMRAERGFRECFPVEDPWRKKSHEDPYEFPLAILKKPMKSL